MVAKTQVVLKVGRNLEEGVMTIPKILNKYPRWSGIGGGAVGDM